ncbi:hypothetical protein LCGC14_1349160, partial [marine sediment metagenome]
AAPVTWKESMPKQRCACPECDCKFNVNPAYGDVCKWCERGEHREEKQ